jgi:hypothetical protein
VTILAEVSAIRDCALDDMAQVTVEAHSLNDPCVVPRTKTPPATRQRPAQALVLEAASDSPDGHQSRLNCPLSSLRSVACRPEHSHGHVCRRGVRAALERLRSARLAEHAGGGSMDRGLGGTSGPDLAHNIASRVCSPPTSGPLDRLEAAKHLPCPHRLPQRGFRDWSEAAGAADLAGSRLGDPG